MNTYSKTILSQVHPFLAAKIELLEEQLGFPINVSAGLRTWEEQHVLWMRGRNPDGSYIDPMHHKGVVTNADAGQSWHNYGLAVDCEPLEKDGTIDWNGAHPQWKKMEQTGIALGLVSGANWKRIVDAPHFQLTAPFPENAPNQEAKTLYLQGGLEAVWNAVVPDVDEPDV